MLDETGLNEQHALLECSPVFAAKDMSNATHTLVPGQRWISNAEPELGLGTILRLDVRTVQVLYAKAGVLRQYAMTSAPLRRALFRVGDEVNGQGKSLRILRVEERHGLQYYVGDHFSMSESELDDSQNISKADERLITGRVDRNDQFEFRLEALQRRANARKSPAFGVMSARVDLIPHQLRVAQIAADRRPPRLLLADEVGLGKTIEASLIIARAIASGRAGRVLVLVPEALIYQWFVEMLRRFNLHFSIFDEERAESIELGGDGRNPFQDEQWVISDLRFLTSKESRRKQIVDAGWDLVVVDEAHHLAWSPESSSPEYDLVEQISASAPGLILLTATPEQLGRTGHFARLRLLDPARFHDLNAFQTESEQFVKASSIAELLINNQVLDESQIEFLASLCDRSVESISKAAAVTIASTAESRAERDDLLNELIDRHGTGRVMFRNRRSVVGGFPKRVPLIDIIELADDAQVIRAHLLEEFLSDLEHPPLPIAIDYARDPRLNWLLHLLDEYPRDKFFLVCKSEAKVIALEDALRTRSGVQVARFHEGMGIVQRDRNAAFFASNDGARLLIAAEIGAEGRNFQFAHHLVLWDLPIDPDQLEQRIGRLDRIGQKHEVLIHVPAIVGSAQAMIAKWFQDGLNAFAQSPQDGREIYKRFADNLTDLAREYAQGNSDALTSLEELIEETKVVHEELAAIILQGRDRLLEFGADRMAPTQYLRDALVDVDADFGIDDFVVRMFEQFGVTADDLGERRVSLDPEMLSTEAFPGFENGPRQISFNRKDALTRDDLAFIRMDHPMVQAGFDLLLSNETGNAAFCIDDTLPARSALLECIFLVECLAEVKLDVERYLPTQAIRIVVDSRLLERKDFIVDAASVAKMTDRQVELPKFRKVFTTLIPAMLKSAETIAQTRARALSEAACMHVHQFLDVEIERLSELRKRNPSVREREIEILTEEREALLTALPQSRVRLDGIRFIASADFLNLRA